jgi:hypothetical protein
MRVEITFSQVGLPNSSVVSSYDLTGTRISAGVGTARTRSSLRIRRFLGGVVRLRSSGRWRFSARYNGSNGTQSLATDDSRTITVN